MFIDPSQRGSTTPPSQSPGISQPPDEGLGLGTVEKLCPPSTLSTVPLSPTPAHMNPHQCSGAEMFISRPDNGVIYIAERSRKSAKLLWSCMPVQPIRADVRVEASDVPRPIRRQAYKLFEGDRLREQ
jgi:hypothetical protein